MRLRELDRCNVGSEFKKLKVFGAAEGPMRGDTTGEGGTGTYFFHAGKKK